MCVSVLTMPSIRLGKLRNEGSSSGHTLSCDTPSDPQLPMFAAHPELAYSNMCWGIYCQGLGIDVFSALGSNLLSLPASFVKQVSHTIPS